MENKKFENVVVGTGISSLGAIIGLINNKKKILIIDAPKIIKTHKNKLIFCNQNLPIVKINNWNMGCNYQILIILINNIN